MHIPKNKKMPNFLFTFQLKTKLSFYLKLLQPSPLWCMYPFKTLFLFKGFLLVCVFVSWEIGMDGLERKPETMSKRKVSYGDLGLRVLALVLTLVAAIVLGVGNQSKLVSIKLIPTLPPVNVSVNAKWQYSSAFVFHVVSNAIACSYAAISILLLLASKNGNKGLVMLIFLLDLAMVALLFSATGAAGAVGLLGYQGNSHVQWKKVCNIFGKFCGRVAVSGALSLFGSLAFFLLVAMAAMRILKKTN